MALNFLDGANQLLRAKNITDSPARHGIGFRKRSANRNSLLELRMRTERKRLETIVEKAGVAFVRQQNDAAIATQSGNAHEFLVIYDAAAGIAGRIRNQEPGCRCEGFLHELGGEPET